MPRPSQQVEAFVLLKRPPSDSFQNFTVFSAEHGTFLVLQRTSKKSTSHSLDLFDEASLLIETSNQGQTWFVKESQLITRHSGIGRSYESLLHASHFSAMIARNLPAIDRQQVADLLSKPLSQQAATDSAVTRLHGRLEEYLRGHTDILID